MTSELQRISEDTRALLTLAETDRQTAVAVFSQLSLEEQQSMVASVSGEGKKELLFLERDSTRLTRSLAPQEVNQAVESATASESDVLLEILTPEQLVFMLDVQCWRGEEIDPQSFVIWLNRLGGSPDSVVADTVARADTDLLARALRPLVTGQAVSRDEVQLALDMGSTYAFTPTDITWLDESAEEFFARVYSLNLSAFEELCMKLIYDDPGLVDFAAYSAHRTRRRAAGAPDSQQTTHLYRPRHPGMHAAQAADRDTTELDTRAGGTLFVERALAHAREHLADQLDPLLLARGLEQLLSRVTIADGRGLNDTDRAATTRKAALFVSLGLEARSHGVVAFAARLVVDAAPADLYRDGASLIRGVHDKVRKIRRILGTRRELTHDGETVLLGAEAEIPRRTQSGGRTRAIASTADLNAVFGELDAVERQARAIGQAASWTPLLRQSAQTHSGLPDAAPLSFRRNSPGRIPRNCRNRLRSVRELS